LALSPGAAALFWAPASALMMIIACGGCALRRPLKGAMLLLCAFGLLGGVIQALQGALGSSAAAYAAGVVCTLVIAACVVRSGISAKDTQRARLRLRFRGIEAEFDAIIDSGNTLRDYLTHRPVIVMPEGRGRRLFGLESDMLRPIFADTAGGRQMMAVFVPQETMLESSGQMRRVCAAVALCGGLSESAPALVPASLMEGQNEA